jgi:hypothetical protein
MTGRGAAVTASPARLFLVRRLDPARLDDPLLPE